MSMKLGCLFAPLSWLTGVGKLPRANSALSASSLMNEGDVHSGPGGYEGMGYSGGYAAEYRAEQEYFDEGEER